MAVDKIIDRVKKMLALGNNAGATEAERETALRMAYNMLAKHNLSISDLPEDASDEVREELLSTISADKWARSLAFSIAELFFCNYYYQRTHTSGKDNHFFIGRQSNVVTAQYMAEYLIASVKKEATKQYKSPTSPLGRSFCVGTVASIRSRVKEMLKDGAEGSSAGTSVALVSLHEREKAANEQWLKQAGTVLVTTAKRADNSLLASGYHAGKEFGKTVSLNQQVGTTSKSLKRIA